MENQKTDVTEENAPLFLVIEETKKTMKLVYVDTKNHDSVRVFEEANLKVKRINEEATDDARYIFTGCRINKRDTDLFRECIENLERKLILTGYRDYREWSMAALIELIEGQVNAAGLKQEEGSEEYPKSFLIPFIPENSLEESLMACFSLIKTATFNPEVMVFNRDPTENRKGYVFPADTFALVVRKDTPVSYDAFRKAYMNNHSGISCVTSLNEKDTERVSVMIFPEDAYDTDDIPLIPVVTVYNRETEAKLTAFFMEWDERYQDEKQAHHEKG